MSDATPAIAARDEAIGRVERSHAAWLDLAESVCSAWVSRQAPGSQFTSERFWDELTACGVAPPVEGRAMGALMRRIHGMGRVAPTDRFTEGFRVSRHHAPLRVWEVVR